jgi:hypothetical protein
MSKTTLQWLRHPAIVVAAGGIMSACADSTPLGFDPQPAFEAVVAADPGTCPELQPPAGSELTFRVYATGVQIYHWNGTSWIFDGPSAVLSADPEGRSTVGTHYVGPTWESVNGGKLVGSVLKRCTPDPNAIPWLSLAAVAQGPGPFMPINFIQRVNTVGGNAPSSAGSYVGEEAEVAYQAEYLFWKTP